MGRLLEDLEGDALNARLRFEHLSGFGERVLRRYHPLLDKRVTNPVDRRGATFDGFRNAIIVPTRPLGPYIRLAGYDVDALS